MRRLSHRVRPGDVALARIHERVGPTASACSPGATSPRWSTPWSMWSRTRSKSRAASRRRVRRQLPSGTTSAVRPRSSRWLVVREGAPSGVVTPWWRSTALDRRPCRRVVTSGPTHAAELRAQPVGRRQLSRRPRTPRRLRPRRQPLRPSGEAAGFGERGAAAVTDEGGHVGIAVDLGPALAGVLGLGGGDLGVEAGEEFTGLGDGVAVDGHIEGVDRLSQPLEPVAGIP